MAMPNIDIANQYCNACHKTYDVKKFYIRHLVLLHKMTLPAEYSEPSNFDPKNLQRKLCDIRYKRRPDFTTHLRNIHRTTPFPADVVPDVDDQDNYCIPCDTVL